FKWRSLKGKSKGFTYSIPNEELELPEKPEMTYVNLAGENRKPIEMTGDRGYIDRKSGFAYFEGSVAVNQGKDKIRAHRLEAAFKPGSNDLEKLTALKDVKISFGKPGKKGQQPQEPEKKPDVVPASNTTPSMSNVFTADSESGKDLSAQFVEMFFYEDGNTISNFHSNGDCTFVLHTYDNKNSPKENRIIKGEEFHAKFDRQGDMEEFRANNKVSVKLQPLDSPKRQQVAASQTIFCEELYAKLIPESGDVKEIQFNDSFKHVQGERTVTSKRAVYAGGEQRKTDLIGEPEIQDASFNITARDMELFEETSNIHAKGNVKSAFVRSEGKTVTTFPFSSPSNNPVYISAEDMLWDSEKSEATYTEKAKLWQDKNVITAAKLIINDREKTLSAYERVHTIFYNNKKKEDAGEEKKEEKDKDKKEPQTKPAQSQPKIEPASSKKEDKKEPAVKIATQSTQSQPAEAKDEETGKLFGGDETSETGPISVDAGIMNYVEKDRIIHFEKEVKIVTESTKINSEKADFYLKPDTSELDRLYAQGKVSINHEQKRGTGTTATFYAKDHKLVLEGGPKLSETGKADIIGRVLTLFLSDDRILIDGQEDGRATTTLSMTSEYTPSSESAKDKDESSSNEKKDTLNAGSKKKKSKKRKSH
ncbi:MAG TPA: LptA/OstA family protein, partial [Acidobacteriota bacterium]|nr:LptA/OstA family protein [Acidobacteriota bacterium]